MKYSEIRPNLNDGDIVLFSGSGPISTGIKWFSRFSDWSHVGMVVSLDDPNFPMKMLYESTTLSNIEDAMSGKERKGVQVVPLSMRIDKYPGNVSVRHLDIRLNIESPTSTKNRRIMMLQSFAETRELFKGRPYEKSQIELVKSAWDGWGGLNKPDTSSLFCSELVAEAYQRAGILPLPGDGNYMSSNEFTPSNFSSRDSKQLDKMLMPGFSLGDEIPIERDAS